MTTSSERKRLPTLPPLPPIVREPEQTTLARYGNRPDEIPRISAATQDATKLASDKLVNESKSGLDACRRIMRMLEEEQAEYAREVLRHSENLCLRQAQFFEACQSAIGEMAKHREKIIAVAQAVANDPPVMTATPTNGSEQNEHQ